MKKKYLLLLCWSALVCLLNATPIPSDNELLLRLYTLSGKNLNYGSSIAEERILELCAKVEKLARDSEDYDNLFRVKLIAVNSLCLQGNLGLAVTKAQEMYDEARGTTSKLGQALAYQALGSTYMHSDEFTQAYETFIEAEELLKDTDDNYSKIRLLTQQMHVCMLLKNMAELQRYLIETRKLLDRIEIPNKNDYIFYLQCYQTYYDLGIKDEELARLSLEQVEKLKPSEPIFDRWYYDLVSCYYELKGDYQTALVYCDSMAMLVKSEGNMNEYKSVLIDKAVLLEKNNEKSDACVTYESARGISDSLNVIRYSQQIDSLHVTYWVDRIEIENAAMHNKMLAWIIFSIIVALGVVTVLIFIARKKNRGLEESRKRLETFRQETSDSIRSKNLFLSNMSHELRTPLNAIVGFAGLITSNDVQDAETRQQCGDLIKQNSELLLKLFNDVADLSALKEDNIRFTYEYYDAVTLCENVINTVEKVKHTYANVFFETSLDKLELFTDSGRLQQVLINLLINATKFTQEGKIILRLDVDKEKEEAIFMVEDTGCGIPLEKQAHIFERFEKLHEGVQGAGLGLSICQLIVEHIGGKIWIDSSYTGGTRFIFTHPLNNNPKMTSK